MRKIIFPVRNLMRVERPPEASARSVWVAYGPPPMRGCAAFYLLRERCSGMSQAHGVTRRSFIATGAGCAALAASQTTARSARAAEAPEASEGRTYDPTTDRPAFLEAPEPIDEAAVVREIDCDVAVVGLGVAGVCAARAAAEGGLQVVGVERLPELAARGWAFGCFNNQWARDMGIEDVDANELVNELMRQCGHMSDYRILKRWADNCGDAVEFYAHGQKDIVYLQPDEQPPADDSLNWVQAGEFYSYDPAIDHERIFAGTIHFGHGHGSVLQANWDTAVETGCCEGLFSTPARQLITEDGRVCGVYAQSLEDGSIVKINARVGVVLATGSYAHNDQMLAYYAPHLYNNLDRIFISYGHNDIEGNPVDNGDGVLMGYWAGGKIEDGPHGMMFHDDLETLGIDAFLQLNARGERYINEDLTNCHLGANLLRQPNSMLYQIFDASFPEQLAAMQGSLGSKDSISPDQVASVEDWVTAQGNTIEELVANLQVSDEVAQRDDRADRALQRAVREGRRRGLWQEPRAYVCPC